MPPTLNEHKVTCPNEAAVLADEYVLTHKRISGERCSQDKYQKISFVSSKLDQPPTGKIYPTMCNYCHQKGHWKKECPLLKRLKVTHVKSAALTTTINTPHFGNDQKTGSSIS